MAALRGGGEAGLRTGEGALPAAEASPPAQATFFRSRASVTRPMLSAQRWPPAKSSAPSPAEADLPGAEADLR